MIVKLLIDECLHTSLIEVAHAAGHLADRSSLFPELNLKDLTVYKIVYSAVNEKPEVQHISLKQWSGRVDLNHRPPGPEPGALARLRYAPKS